MINEDTLKSIEKLHSMKAEGVISESDYEEAKRKLLDGRSTARPVRSASSDISPDLSSDGYLAWMLLPLRRYAQFDGRSSRREFWLFLLAVNVILGALALIWMLDTNYFGQTGALGSLAFAILVLGMLGVIVPYIAVQVRRFHDQGRSGWFALINIIPYIGAIIVLVMMAIPGTEGENEYGPDPLI